VWRMLFLRALIFHEDRLIGIEKPQLKLFEPVKLTGDDLRRFVLSEGEIEEWRALYSDPVNNPWNGPEMLEGTRRLQLILQAFDIGLT